MEMRLRALSSPTAANICHSATTSRASVLGASIPHACMTCGRYGRWFAAVRADSVTAGFKVERFAAHVSPLWTTCVFMLAFCTQPSVGTKT